MLTTTTPETAARMSPLRAARWSPFVLVLEEHPDRPGEIREVWESTNLECDVVEFERIERAPTRPTPAAPPVPQIAPGWQQREAFALEHGVGDSPRGRRP